MPIMKKNILSFVTQPAWALLMEAVIVVVATSKGFIPAEWGGVLGSIVFNGWLLSVCYFIEEKMGKKFKIPVFLYLFSCIYFFITPYFFYGVEISGSLKSLYGLLEIFYVFYTAYLVSKISESAKSIFYTFFMFLVFVIGIAFYPIGIWFIQPKIVGFLRVDRRNNFE